MRINENRKPDFEQLVKVLKGGVPQRPVLFDFIIGENKENMLLDGKAERSCELEKVKTNFLAFANGGYDHVSIIVRGLDFVRKSQKHEGVYTKSLNEGTIITDEESLKKYKWPELSDCDFSIISEAGKFMPQGARMIPFSLDGILENTIGVLGYENLCYLLYDDPSVVEQVFEHVGSRITQYFEKCLEFDEVGAILCNDDWGFNSQTMLPPQLLRKYVFPWYKQIVAKAHQAGKYAILHSCGYYNDILDDILDMGFDGRHSYEDKIVPVEQAYENLHGRIAVLGGIDVDFLARSTPQQISERCDAMLVRVATRGGYALGSGNSVPDYVPDENYLALLCSANQVDRQTVTIGTPKK